MWNIPRILVNKILAHAQREFPRECVGVLSGSASRVTGWHPLSNVAKEDRRFLADPTGQIRLFERLRQEGLEVVAIYHSHPFGPTAPSALDLEEAYDPDILNLIVSLDTAGRLDMNGYLMRNGQAELQEVTVSD